MLIAGNFVGVERSSSTDVAVVVIVREGGASSLLFDDVLLLLLLSDVCWGDDVVILSDIFVSLEVTLRLDINCLYLMEGGTATFLLELEAVHCATEVDLPIPIWFTNLSTKSFFLTEFGSGIPLLLHSAFSCSQLMLSQTDTTPPSNYE